MKEVILGLPGQWAGDNLEASDHYTTKVGGVPDWPFPVSSIGPDLLQCNSCQSSMCLIAQVYAPISIATLKIEDRVLYIFCCTDLRCGSWRAIRVQKPSNLEEAKTGDLETSHLTVSSTSAPETKWWNDLYSFDLGSENDGENDDMDMLDLAKAFADAASLSSGSGKDRTRRHIEPHGKANLMASKSREVHGSALVLPCFYICYEEDKSYHRVATASSSNPSCSVEEVLVNKINNDDLIQEEAWEGEMYEYDKALNADRTYLKFKKRMDKCPEQCFRYSFGGKPLLAAGDLSDPGQCCLCGETRHYEMQLMPPLVYFLQEKAVGLQRDLMDRWSWLTLMIFTCSKNCSQNPNQDELISREGRTVVEETVIPQFEIPVSEASKLGLFS